MRHVVHTQENLRETDHLQGPGREGTIILQDMQHTHNVTFFSTLA
jgi:hypothetical protein